MASGWERVRKWLLGRVGDARTEVVAAPEARVAGGPGGFDLPAFTLGIAERMRFDPQVRIGLGARNGLATAARVDALGGEPEEAAWVQRQWDRLWASSAPALLRTKLYGFLPFEAIYRPARSGPRSGGVELERLRDVSPRRTRVLVREGRIVGFAMRRPGGGADVPVVAPKGLVCTFDAEFGNPYGRSLLERAYPSWHEKWMEGGVKKTLRLRMIKDAYVGDVVWYPPDKQAQLPSGETVSWRDVTRELVEARLSGGALTLPLVYDRDGRKLLDYSPPHDVGGATAIFQWKHDVDQEIWKALEVPPEVIEASRRGSFSGRSIPLLIALSAVQTELAELVQCIDRDLLRPLCQLRFGAPPEYELRLRPLVETYAEALRGGLRTTPLGPTPAPPASEEAA